MLFRKKSIICVLLISTLALVGGCSNNITINESSNAVERNKTTEENKGQNQGESKEENKTNPSEKNSSTDSNKASFSDKKSNTGESTNNTLDPLKAEKELLDKIKKLAVNGEIINCEFKVKETNISTVEDKWGEADSTDFIKAAKGTYSYYKDYGVALGWNKGMQIFEVRTFDKSLNTIPYSLVEEVFGKPEYTSTYDKDAIIGYTAGKDFKILFVFAGGANDLRNAKLDHYSVLYPQGTVNSMAGDSGREW